MAIVHILTQGEDMLAQRSLPARLIRRCFIQMLEFVSNFGAIIQFQLYLGFSIVFAAALSPLLFVFKVVIFWSQIPATFRVNFTAIHFAVVDIEVVFCIKRKLGPPARQNLTYRFKPRR